MPFKLRLIIWSACFKRPEDAAMRIDTVHEPEMEQPPGCSLPDGHARERRGIVLAAIDLIAARGVRGLTLDQVAREAGVDADEVREHFANPNELAAATMDHIVDEILRAQGCPGESAPLRTQLERLARLIENRPTLFLVHAELELGARRDPLIRASLVRAEERWQAAT